MAFTIPKVSVPGGVGRLGKISRVGWLVIASLVVLVFPLVMPFTALAANILIYGLYALGFNLVYGYLGLLSFGHAALFGTGAYFCGIAIVGRSW